MAQFVEAALQAGKSRLRFPMVSLKFYIDAILPVALWPRGDSASNRNEHQEYFGGKGDRCVGQTTLPPPRAVMKSGSFNLQEPSGPVQACNGTALAWYELLIILL